MCKVAGFDPAPGPDLENGVQFLNRAPELCVGIPLLSAAFIASHTIRLISLVIASTIALLAAGMAGAWLGGAGLLTPTTRVLVGG